MSLTTGSGKTAQRPARFRINPQLPCVMTTKRPVFNDQASCL
ncbi:hypothetical protein [Cognatiyoonia koreensis]|nr:hypothetical protein [Cognatiyoonia koreensis]